MKLEDRNDIVIRLQKLARMIIATKTQSPSDMQVIEIYQLAVKVQDNAGAIARWALDQRKESPYGSL